MNRREFVIALAALPVAASIPAIEPAGSPLPSYFLGGSGLYMLTADTVAKIGGGDVKQGHRILDTFLNSMKRMEVI